MSRLERWTGQSVGIEHQEAKAMLGVSVVKDFFEEGISLDTAMSQVNSYAMSDISACSQKKRFLKFAGDSILNGVRPDSSRSA